MSRARLIAVAAVTLALLSCRQGPAAEAPKPITHTIAIDGLSFQPATLTVKAGDSIEWVNKDPLPHTVTSTAGGFDSHDIAAGSSWTYTPKVKGDFPYACTYHPTMMASLRVE